VVRVVTRPDDGVFLMVNGVHIADYGDQELMNANGWGLASLNGPATADQFVVHPRLEGLATVEAFELSNGANLDQPTTGVRYKWRPWIGPSWTVQSGQARPTSTNYTNTWVDSSTEQAEVEVKVSALGTNGWLMFRFDEFENTYYRLGYSGGVYTLGYVEHDVAAPPPVTVQVLSSPPAPQVGDVLRVFQEPDGKVRCYINGVLVFSFQDATTSFRTTTYGLAAQGTAAAFDNFKMTPYSR
jgi:hypothetical protein